MKKSALKKAEKAKKLERNSEPKMFKRLKRRFIWTATLTSSVVLILAFSVVYISASNDTKTEFRRPQDRSFVFSEDIDSYLEKSIQDDRAARLNALLLTLILTGISIEVIVAMVSIYFAEKSIEPVRKSYEAQKNFIANASHEIKTPLAVIQANLEAADIQGNQWIDNVAKKAEELAALNSELLSLARMEAEPEKTEPEKVELKSLVTETVKPYAPKLAEKNVKLKINVPKDDIDKTLNKAALEQLLNILIDNAIKYSEKKIEINVSEKEISIKNDGATIPAENLPHIFDRFYQTDKTKSGVGLGLAIGKSLADHNKWRLEAASDRASTTFTLVL